MRESVCVCADWAEWDWEMELGRKPILTPCWKMFDLFFIAFVITKVAQSCPTLCDPFGILQARILEWVALPFSRGSSQPRDPTQVSHIVDRIFTS